MDGLILSLQCVALYILVTIVTMLDNHTTRAREEIKRWVVHVVRDTDANRTPSVVLSHTGTLIECNSRTHNALMQASQNHSTEDLLCGNGLRESADVQLEFMRVVHTDVDRERMQQLLETHECDIVPIDADAPEPAVILDDVYALLGVLLSLRRPITANQDACAHAHPPSTPMPSPRRTPCRRRVPSKHHRAAATGLT